MVISTNFDHSNKQITQFGVHYDTPPICLFIIHVAITYSILFNLALIEILMKHIESPSRSKDFLCVVRLVWKIWFHLHKRGRRVPLTLAIKSLEVVEDSFTNVTIKTKCFLFQLYLLIPKLKFHSFCMEQISTTITLLPLYKLLCTKCSPRRYEGLA